MKSKASKKHIGHEVQLHEISNNDLVIIKYKNSFFYKPKGITALSNGDILVKTKENVYQLEFDTFSIFYLGKRNFIQRLFNIF